MCEKITQELPAFNPDPSCAKSIYIPSNPLDAFIAIRNHIESMPLDDRIEMMLTVRAWVRDYYK